MKKVPSNFQHLCFRKKDIRDRGVINLNGDMYNLFLEIDADKSINTIAQDIHLDLPVIRDALSRLLALDLIEVVGDMGPKRTRSFMSHLRNQFVKAIGPLGSFLIEDIIREQNFFDDRFSQEEASEFVLRLAAEIQDSTKRHEFKKSMIEYIMKGNDT
jgi:hypothetical protein